MHSPCYTLRRRSRQVSAIEAFKNELKGFTTQFERAGVSLQLRGELWTFLR